MTSRLEKIVMANQGVAFNPVNGETYRLSESAVQLVHLLRNGADFPALLCHLLATYEVDEATAQRDLETFLSTLELMNWTEDKS